MRPFLSSLLFTASVMATPGPGGPGRPFYDRLLDRLDSTRTLGALPRQECQPLDAANQRLCTAFIAERQLVLSGDRTIGRQAEAGFERAVLELPKSAVAWYGLGIVRMQLAQDTAFSRGGAEMGVGVSYLTGAVNAFAAAVDLDPTFGRAVEALALCPIGRDEGRTIARRVALLRKVRAAIPARAALAVATVERNGGSIDSALALERRALHAAVVDSGTASLALARDLYATGRSQEGRDVLLRGAGTPTPLAASAYRAELGFVASPGELTQWDSLPPARRPAWLADFWQKRDISEGRNDGARLVEHYQRVEYALKHFALVLPQTGRQRMLSYLPSGMDMTATVLDRAMSDPSCGSGVAQYALLDRDLGSHVPWRDYKPTQDEVDDRGVIWIRHGPPTRRAISNATEAAEVWQYDRAPHPLVLQFHEVLFNGIGASTLVSTLVTMPAATRLQLCGVEYTLCIPGDDVAALAMRKQVTSRNVCSLAAAVVPVAAEEIRRDHDAGLVALHAATTTDSYTRDFAKALRPGVQMLGLARTEAGQQPELVVAYALPGEQLAATRSGGRTTYKVQLHLLASRFDGSRVDLDTAVTFQVDSALGRGQYLNGLLPMALPRGAYHVSLVITQPDGRGAIAHMDNVILPDWAGGPLSASDVALGVLNHGVHWNSGRSNVWLNPADTFQENQPVEAYFQVHGLQSGQQYAVRVELYKGDPVAGAPLVLSIGTTILATGTSMEIARTLDVSRLGPGRYRMQAVVSAGSQVVTTGSWLTVVRR
ncbi:MAG TPA: hypothetical protein VGM77_12385 [Gemmatimonadales bacterium]|jgi:hypothetical protein